MHRKNARPLRVYPKLCVNPGMGRKTGQNYQSGVVALSPPLDYVLTEKCVQVKGGGCQAAVHFTLDGQAGFCYSGMRSSK